MSDLTEAISRLAALHVSSPALLVQTPEGEYAISPDASGGAAENAFVISRSQLGTLMWESGVGRADLADPNVAATVAALVAEFRPLHTNGGTSW